MCSLNSSFSPGLSFLNIGSGTGYFSCAAGYILQAQGINHGIELHEDLVQFAEERVQEYLQFCPVMAQDICQPKFLAGNCFRLDPSLCSYDRVYCGAACPISKVAFIVAFTKVGGFAIIPCRNRVSLHFLYSYCCFAVRYVSCCFLVVYGNYMYFHKRCFLVSLGLCAAISLFWWTHWGVVNCHFPSETLFKPLTLETHCQVVANNYVSWRSILILMSGLFRLFSQMTIFEKTELVPIERCCFQSYSYI